MKTILSMLCSVVVFLSVYGEEVDANKCKIRITAENYPLDTVTLLWSENGARKTLPVALPGGKGEIEVATADLTSLIILNRDMNSVIKIGDKGVIPLPPVEFFAENGKLVQISFDNLKWPEMEISGGTVNNDLMTLRKVTAPLKAEQYALRREMNNEGADQQSIEKQIEEISAKIEFAEKEFMASNPESYISLTLLRSKPFMPVAEAESIFAKLPPAVRDSELGKQVASELEKKKTLSPGQPAPLFSKKDKDGNIITLADLRGKYVLLDFWGSWCGPCRQSHPHLIALHQKYAPMGMEFISIAFEHVAIDKARELWLKAVQEDKLTWTQILNNEDEKSCNVVRLYDIKAFPTKILIDREGKIIAAYLGDDGQLVDEKLKELFPE
ncbi:MAG: TlpA family protein disulfide reductase [Dysgonamonadaceae bacterium]|jgi:thiol-disulfide isomerase/thioredoxin|nr:TlpA family protein disulfide reductase [Dysgonamonadaceae bacterium]